VAGIISLALLAGSTLALYVFHLAGPWRWMYAISQTLAQFLLVFVLMAQVFKKVPVLATIAPTQSEPPFAAAEGVVLAIFLALAVAAAMRFRPAAAGAAPT
jgi:MFS family permease